MASLLLILLCTVPLATARKGDGVRAANDFIRYECPAVSECHPPSFTGPNPVMPCEDWEFHNSCFRQTVENCSLDHSGEFNTAMNKKKENCMSQCATTLSAEECDGYIVQTTTTTTATTTAADTTSTQSAAATTLTGLTDDNATVGFDDEGVDDDNFNWMDLLGNSGMCLKGGYALLIVAAIWV